MPTPIDHQVYPVIWQNDHVVLIDQNQLPNRYTVVTIYAAMT